MAKKRILIVDDEARIRRFVHMNLDLEGYDVSEAENGLDALARVRDEFPDLVLLDVMMPDLDGFETLAHIREFSAVPVIMLTVKSDEEDRIRGLDLGADDYVTKPFSPRELSSRIRAVLRRVEPSPSQTAEPLVIDEDLAVDFPRREVIVRGERVRLRPTEYKLLVHLVENAGWIVPQETLLAKVWGPEYRDDSQLLRLYITYLRKKIEADSSKPRYILTERGVGYRFVGSGKKVSDGVS
ncbi:MAG: DNA-binding response regulator [Chloroflexi bacterium HGW-Chloroflexi-1]|nr:MAG: DNA-binding response regulator [Chloroflexi bacterium HGW-Chloroflexi-1]